MAIVLVSLPGSVGLGGIINATVVSGLLAWQRRVGGDNRAALKQLKMHRTLQVDRKAQVCSGGKYDNATARFCSRFNGAIHRISVQGFAIARGSMRAYIKYALRG